MIEVTQAQKWSLSPHGWIQGTVMDPEEMSGDFEGLGFFHVTTQLSAVRRSQCLKSRCELTNVVALGGGTDNEAADCVSFTEDIYRARWLQDAIKTAAAAARNVITASKAATAVIEWTEFTSEEYYYLGDVEEPDEDFLEQLKDFCILIGFEATPEEEELLWSWGGWLSLIEAHSQEIDADRPTGEAKYQLIQDMEGYIRRTFLNDNGIAEPTVGFTAPWETFRQVNPEEVAIVQCEVMLGVESELVPAEWELRIKPKFIRLVSDSCSGNFPVRVYG